MDDLGGIQILFPHLVEVNLDQVTGAGSGVCLWVSPRASTARCPTCGISSKRIHSRYDRHLADQPISGQDTTVRLRARRFFCLADGCAVKTFAERVDGLTTRRARRTPPLLMALARIGRALAGRAGTWLAQGLGMRVGRSSVLRLIRSLPDPSPGPPARDRGGRLRVPPWPRLWDRPDRRGYPPSGRRVVRP